MASWSDLGPSAELRPGGCRLIRRDKLAIALFREPDGSLHALDNRCPHEGYPLLDGPRRDGVLTCPWHNYKFRLADGVCVQGEEAARVFATRERDGRIEADLSPPDPAQERSVRLASLATATLEGKLGQAARDLARLLEAGASLPELALFAARLDARHGEYGSSHALPIAADVLELHELPLPEQTLLLLLQPYELVSEGHRRRPAHALPQLDGDPARLASAIEDEDLPVALAAARTLLRREGWPALREALQAAVCEHFLDFGHPLIYVDKLDQLAAIADPEALTEIALGLLRNLIGATREDLLPGMRRVHEHLCARPQPPLGDAPLGERAAPLGAAILAGESRWIGELDAALRAGIDPQELLDLIVRCASQRLLHFDASIHQSIEIQDGWLDVSHALSFAHAVRPLLRQRPLPHSLRALFFAAHFVARAHRLQAATPFALPATARFEAQRFASALRDGELPELLAQAQGAWADGQVGALRRALAEWALVAPATRPIFVAHVLKMLRVGFAESERLADPLPLLATLRFALTPKRERALAALAHDAAQLIVHGRLPRTLSS